MTRRFTLIGLTATVMVAFTPAIAWPQAWPSKPIRLIVDGPAGGINDIWARRYAQRIGEAMQSSVVVDNRPGASGSIAAEALARSAPDGYTMMFGGMNPLVAFPSAGGVVRYDPTRDFAPVALGTLGYPLLVVNSSLGIRSVQDLIARARAKPDEIICGTGGHASVQHFACDMFARAAGVKIRMVPYKGGSAALVDAASGQVHIAVGYSGELLPFTDPGKLLPIAAYAPKRLPKFPDAPTWAEAGLPGLELPSFSGFFMPQGTPAAVIDRLNAEAIKAMTQRPEMMEWVRSLGGNYEPLKPAELGALVRSQQALWKKMSETSGIRVE